MIDGSAGLNSPDGTEHRSILNGIKLARGLLRSPDSKFLLFTDAEIHYICVCRLVDGKVGRIMRPAAATDEGLLRWVRFKRSER